jgi:hypothetical protein
MVLFVFHSRNVEDTNLRLKRPRRTHRYCEVRQHLV